MRGKYHQSLENIVSKEKLELEKKFKKPKWLNFAEWAILLGGATATAYFAVNGIIKNNAAYNYIQQHDIIYFFEQITNNITREIGELNTYPKAFKAMGMFIDGFGFLDLIYASGIHIGVKKLNKALKSAYVKIKFPGQKLKKREGEGTRIRKNYRQGGLKEAFEYSVDLPYKEARTSLSFIVGKLIGLVDKKKEHEIYQGLKNKSVPYISVYRKIYLYNLKHGNEDEAIFSMLDLVHQLRRNKRIFKPTSNTGRLIVKSLLTKKKEKSFLYHTDQLLSHFSRDMTRIDALDYFYKHREVFLDGTEKTLLSAILISDFLKQTRYVNKDWNRMRDRLWQMAIDKINSDENTTEMVISESGKKVKLLGPSKFIKSTLILKENENLGPLEEERQKVLELEQVVINSPTMHVAPVVYVTENPAKGGHFMVIRKKEGTMLAHTQEKAIFETAAEYLANIHKKLSTSKWKRDYQEVAKQRMMSSEYDFLKPIVKEWGFLFENIQGDYVFDKDAHGYNWIACEEGIIAIDLEDRGLNRQEFDVAKLVGLSGLSEKDTEIKEQVIIKYAKKYGVKNYNQFEKGVISATPLCALNFFIYSSSHSVSNDADKRRFLENGRRSLYLLQDKRAIELDKYFSKAVELVI